MSQPAKSVIITGEVLACEPAMSAEELFNFAIQIAATASATTVLNSPNGTATAQSIANTARDQLAHRLQLILEQETQ